jgi:hypothetical protein
MPRTSERSGLLYVRCVLKQLWSTFFPIPIIGAGVFNRCDGCSGCMWKKLALAANPVLRGEGHPKEPLLEL